jgi:hypothetical protein
VEAVNMKNFLDKLSPNQYLSLIILNTIVFVVICLFLSQFTLISQTLIFTVIKAFLIMTGLELAFAYFITKR